MFNKNINKSVIELFELETHRRPFARNNETFTRIILTQSLLNRNVLLFYSRPAVAKEVVNRSVIVNNEQNDYSANDQQVSLKK